MKDLKVWVRSIVLDSIFVGSMIYLMYNDVPWLSNIIYFLLWLLTILLIIVGFLATKELAVKIGDIGYTPAQYVYAWASDVVILSTIAATGHFVLATFYAVASLLMYGIRDTARKNAEEVSVTPTLREESDK